MPSISIITVYSLASLPSPLENGRQPALLNTVEILEDARPVNPAPNAVCRLNFCSEQLFWAVQPIRTRIPLRRLLRNRLQTVSGGGRWGHYGGPVGTTPPMVNGG
jgi:hypothetical protein